MSTSEQLERETDEERARISETLTELRARMTPGHVVDQLVDYANDSSGGTFFRNLRQQAVDNPVPVALVGAGLAWLAISGRQRDSTSGARVHNRTTASNLQDTARETADSVADTTSSTYAAASELAGDATARAQGAARSAADSVAETASATYGVAADQARRAGETLQKSASDMRSKVTETRRSIMDFFHEQPLVLAGIGLAIGAAIGAASPSTEVEDATTGESSDALKKETADLAGEQLKKGQAVAERGWQSATEEAEKQGFVATSNDDDRASTSHVDSTTNETPLVPSTEDSASREDERTSH
jgi:hypothetical protein